MARMPDLVSFAQRHGLKIGTIEDLIAYRLQNDRIVNRTASRKVESTFGGTFDLHVYETTVDPVEHLVLVRGDLSGPEPVLVRVHAVNMPADLLGIGAPNRPEAFLQKCMQMIAAEGRGVIVLIRDLRPRSLSSWLAEREQSKTPQARAERRRVEIGIGAQIFRDLGVTDMELLTNVPRSRYVGIEGYGLKIVSTREVR
jgi:3,4-dihydroxy 2-butanone 4-phosphate synthase / GTP cyclohydrolase II